MGYFDNFRKQWPLTTAEEKELGKIEANTLGFQKNLKTAFSLGLASKDRHKNILRVIDGLSKKRKQGMQKIWKRRWRAIKGK